MSYYDLQKNLDDTYDVIIDGDVYGQIQCVDGTYRFCSNDGDDILFDVDALLFIRDSLVRLAAIQDYQSIPTINDVHQSGIKLLSDGQRSEYVIREMREADLG